MKIVAYLMMVIGLALSLLPISMLGIGLILFGGFCLMEYYLDKK